jgi:hypothetical protein
MEFGLDVSFLFLNTKSTHVLYGSGLWIPAGRGTEREEARIRKSGTHFLLCVTTHITVSAFVLGFQSWEVDEQCSLWRLPLSYGTANVHTNNVLQLANVRKKRSSRIKLRNIVRKHCSLTLFALVWTQLYSHYLVFHAYRLLSRVRG